MKKMGNEIAVGEDFTTFFLIQDPPQVKKSKNDKDYLMLKLSDKSGTLDARMWDVPPDLDVPALGKSFVKVQGTLDEWKGQKQVKVVKIRKVFPEDEVVDSDFFETTPYDVETMWGFLVNEVAAIHDEKVRQLSLSLLQSYETQYKACPASKSVHHNYIGGLLEHVCSMWTIGKQVCEHYKLNSGLVLFACAFHDLGKCVELEQNMGISYTLEGQLLGHISSGMIMISEHMDRISEFPRELRVALLHLVASHHGLLEFGSPKVPMMREAVAFHLIDMMDSKMMICEKILKEGVDASGFTVWSKYLDGQLYKFPEES